MSDTIAAIATGYAQTAIGILRMSGDEAISVADGAFRGKTRLADAPDRQLVYGALTGEGGEVIDWCLATVSRAPHSYTGENTVEFQCHGSPVALSLGLAALFKKGARQALPGEFSKRAFLNGKMDVTQSEAIIDLISAETRWAASNAVNQLGGALKTRVEAVYDSLLDVLAHFQAEVDYPDEDIDEFSLNSAGETIAAAANETRKLEQGYSRGRLLREGAPAAIIGRPNVGKSSLLNALLGYDRAIVTEIAGTTRDTIEEKLVLGDVLLRLTDTAGIRETSDTVERLGVERSIKAASGAWLAIAVFDGSQALTEEDISVVEAAKCAQNVVAVINKSDLPQLLDEKTLEISRICHISAKNGDGLEALREQVEDVFGGAPPAADGSVLTNLRQYTAAENALSALNDALAAISGGSTPDAVLTDVERAMEHLGEITGSTLRDDMIARIFSRFCVGK